MATRYVKTANSELGTAYNPAQAGIQAQQPGIQDLYAGLLTALEQNQTAGLQTVVDSAARRGVSRATLAADTGATLAQEGQLGAAQLGVSRAGDMAALQGSLTDLNTGRATAATAYGGQKQQGDIDYQTSRLQRKISIEDQRLAIKKLNQQAEMSKKAKAYADAKAAQAAASSGGGYGGGSSGGGGGGSGGGSNLTPSQALDAIGGLFKPGKDGYVDPKQYNEYRKAFIDAGYSSDSFRNAFSSLVNPAHQHRNNTKKLVRYNGVWLNK